jgi:hypothetical protein
MTAVSEVSKLAELRAKTDRDLVRVIANALEVGVQCASAAPDCASPLYARAKAIYANAVQLMPAVEDTARRQRLEKKLDQLRDSLAKLAPARAASSSAC